MGMDFYHEGRDSSRREGPYVKRALGAVHRSIKRAIKSPDPVDELKKMDMFLDEVNDALEWKTGPSPDWSKLDELIGE